MAQFGRADAANPTDANTRKRHRWNSSSSLSARRRYLRRADGRGGRAGMPIKRIKARIIIMVAVIAGVVVIHH